MEPFSFSLDVCRIGGLNRHRDAGACRIETFEAYLLAIQLA